MVIAIMENGKEILIEKKYILINLPDIMQKEVLILLYKQYKHYIIRSSKFITLTMPLSFSKQTSALR